MDSIRLINYRSLEDTGEVKIKPLTFLLGANSSGKSSFLKILPLIKQSVNSLVRGTFLWNGALVDFKDFQNVVRNGEGEISMSFTLQEVPYFTQRYFHTNIKIPSLKFNFSLAPKEDRWDYMKYLKLEANNICYEVTFKPTKNNREVVESFRVNGEDFSKIHDYINAINLYGLIPRLLYKNGDHWDDESEIAFKKTQELINNSTQQDQFTLRRFISGVPQTVIKEKDINELLKRCYHRDILLDSATKQKLTNWTLFYNFNNFVDTINAFVGSFASSITYVAPLRANFERYYRFQNFSVDAIDADGHNLAMFLNSLDDSQMTNFNDWLSRVFKFKIKLTPSVGHVAIEIQEHAEDFRNLVDLGFGYTELLPILAMIWKDVEYDMSEDPRNNRVRRRQRIFAIEQPELHLHPRFQAKFATLIVNVIKDAKENDLDVRFVIETHSDTIINKIGQLIERGLCDNEDVNVVLFNAKDEGMENYVECTKFSKEGYIENWPYGFFEEDSNVD